MPGYLERLANRAHPPKRRQRDKQRGKATPRAEPKRRVQAGQLRGQRVFPRVDRFALVRRGDDRGKGEAERAAELDEGLEQRWGLAWQSGLTDPQRQTAPREGRDERQIASL